MDRSGKLNVRTLLGLTAIALLCKLVVFFLSIRTSMSFSLPFAENWQDFSLAYVPAADAFKSGFAPYGDFYYPYPPLFLYALTSFSYLPLPSWSSALPLVIADALTVVPVYLLARELVSERYSLIASIAFVLAPINLYYVDYLWLNPSLTTLFLMVSVYFLIKRRFDLSAVSLALSIGFKQTALLALPIIMIVVWRSLSRRGAMRYLLITASICFLISVPYIFLSPGPYLYSVFRVPLDFWWGIGQWPPNYFQIGVGTGTATTPDTLNWITSRWNLIVQGIGMPVTLALPMFIFLLPTTLSWVYDPYSTGLLLLILLAGYAALLYRTRRNRHIEEKDSLRYVLYGLLLLFAFYPLYKYYAVGIIPIFALLMRSKRDALGFTAFNFALMLIPRYFASWVLLISLLWLLRHHLAGLLRKPISPTSQNAAGLPQTDLMKA